MQIRFACRTQPPDHRWHSTHKDSNAENLDRPGSSHGLARQLLREHPHAFQAVAVELDIQGNTFKSFVTQDGRYLFVDGPLDMSETPSNSNEAQQPLPEMLEKESTEVEGWFQEITELDVCMENDKPIIYFFGSDSCPYCEWEKPIIEEVVAEFGDAIDFRKRYDGTTDVDVLLNYSQGAVPTIIVGCKYYRTGAGQSLGEEGEKEALRAVFCRATGGTPSSVCGG